MAFPSCVTMEVTLLLESVTSPAKWNSNSFKPRTVLFTCLNAELDIVGAQLTSGN